MGQQTALGADALAVAGEYIYILQYYCIVEKNATHSIFSPPYYSTVIDHQWSSIEGTRNILRQFDDFPSTQSYADRSKSGFCNFEIDFSTLGQRMHTVPAPRCGACPCAENSSMSLRRAPILQATVVN